MLLASGSLSQFRHPYKTALFQSKETDEDGNRYVGFVDGHVEVFTADK